MIFKKKFNKIILLLMISIIFISTIFFKSTPVASDKRESAILEDIVVSYNEGKNINLKKYNLYYDEEKSKDYNTDELLALGYYGVWNESENATYFLKSSIEKFNSKTNFEAKYMTLYLLISEMVKNNEIDDVLKYIHEINNFSMEEIDKKTVQIKDILFLVVNIVDGRNSVVEILEKIIENEDKLSIESISSYKNMLGMYYVMNGEYSNGAEMFLNIIDEDTEVNSVYTLKSIVDLGSMFVMLNKYEIAEQTYRDALEIGKKINSNNTYNMMMVYAYINLYEVLVYQNKIDEFFEISQEIEKYYKGIEENMLNSTLENFQIIKASAYIKKGDLAKAYEYIISDIIEEDSLYIDYDIFKYIVYGDYYLAQGEYDTAREIYENSYLEKKNVLNRNYEKMILQRLVDLSKLQGEIEKEVIYQRELIKIYEVESEAVSDEYINYIISKYNYNKELNILNKYKLTVIIIMSLFTIVASIIVIEYLKNRKTIKYDGLTDVYKREYFNYSFQKIFKRKKNFIIIIFDIDDFKAINDTHGHDFGDRVLQKSAETVKGLLDNKSKIFRYGGEEFVVLAKYNTIKEGAILAEKIRAAIEDSKWERGIKVTISIGVANKKGSMEATFKTADSNLYKAKESGKNKVIY